jgi:hypothetical protein
MSGLIENPNVDKKTLGSVIYGVYFLSQIQTERVCKGLVEQYLLTFISFLFNKYNLKVFLFMSFAPESYRLDLM